MKKRRNDFKPKPDSPVKNDSHRSKPELPVTDLLLRKDYPDPKWFRSLRTKTLNWYAKNKRPLPWRTQNTPYRVWISEIMLQQTQVQTVIDYFNRFISQFPTIKALAKASESQVLSLWEGLGYYRRARNLHAAARLICEKHGGIFPSTFEEVLNLPGIGRYTAGAILSISQDQRLPILEGNTYRLHARLLGLTQNPRDRDAENLLWDFATDLLPGATSKLKSGDLNQALMEMGATVCKVTNPDCGTCPLKSLCVAHELGMESELPRPATPIKYENRRQALLVLEDKKGRALVRKRGEDEWWSGLWDFVRVDLPHSNSGTQTHKKSIDHWIAEHLDSEFGIKLAMPIEKDFSFKHAVTKYRIQLDCYHVRQSEWNSDGTHQPLALEEIAQLPLNVTARKLLKRILETDTAASKK